MQGEHAKNEADSDSDMDSDGDSEDEDPARLHTVKVPTDSGLNRVRAMPQRPGVVAAWGENGRVQVWLSPPLRWYSGMPVRTHH